MKDFITIVLLVIIVFLLWNQRQTATYETEGLGATLNDVVPPDVTQSILERVLAGDAEIQPIETLFINHQGDGVYNSRFMFLNTKHFYGVQYDVQAKVNAGGSVDIMNKTEVAKVDYSKAYKPDRYESYETIQNSIDAQLKEALKQPIKVPSTESYRY